MTRRRGGKLARRYGHTSLYDLIDSLPKEARVADVGAGASPFGREVCALRDDIQWANIDLRYGNQKILKRLTKKAPPNLEFLAVDITDSSQDIGTSRFDKVFSYWMLPHIIIESRASGVAAARNIVSIARETGSIAVGPCMSYGCSARQFEMADYDEDEYNLLAEEITESCMLPRVVEVVQRRINTLDHALGKLSFTGVDYKIDFPNPS